MQARRAGRTCNVIPGDAGVRQCLPKELGGYLIIWFHEVLCCFPIFIPYTVFKSQVVITMKVDERRIWADEREIGTSIQQATDEILSGPRIFRRHSEMQRRSFVEFIDRVYIAFVVTEDMFQCFEGYT